MISRSDSLSSSGAENDPQPLSPLDTAEGRFPRHAVPPSHHHSPHPAGLLGNLPAFKGSSSSSGDHTPNSVRDSAFVPIGLLMRSESNTSTVFATAGSTPNERPLSEISELLHLREEDVRQMNNPKLIETVLALLALLKDHQQQLQFQSADAMASARSAQDLRAALRSTHQLSKAVDEEGSKMLNQYVVLDDLGKGSQGKVKLAYDTERNTPVAIKIVRKPAGSAFTYAHQESIRREIAVMKKLRHRHIVALLEVIDDPDSAKMYIVMQHIDNGVIGKVQQDLTCKPIPPKALLKYTRQITAGLEYLHRHHVAHRDIKPENILVNINQECFLSDFGVSEITGDAKKKVQGKCGTLLFMSPELLRESEADGFQVDMWALGVTLWVLLTGKMPFQSQEQILNPHFTPVLPPAGSSEQHSSLWERLLPMLLERNPKNRMTAKEAHRYVKAHEFDEDEDVLSSTMLQSTDISSAVSKVVKKSAGLDVSSSGVLSPNNPHGDGDDPADQVQNEASNDEKDVCSDFTPTPPQRDCGSVKKDVPTPQRNPFVRNSSAVT
jgi:serine/threonine protein kinase